MPNKPPPPLPVISPKVRAEMRRAKTLAETKFTVGGGIRSRWKQQPVTLRRADYEKERDQ